VKFDRTQVGTTILLLLLLIAAIGLFGLQPGAAQWIDPGRERWLIALGAVALYLLLCLALWRRRRKAHEVASDANWLVVYASQTGHAEQLAWQSAKALQAGGASARVISIHDLDAPTLRAAPRALFVASTTGEGDPPDGALRFLREVMAQDAPLALDYAVLALGDRSYSQYCGWGRRLDAWLQERGATPLFERIEVDDADAMALQSWQQRIEALVGGEPLVWSEPEFESWTLTERRVLNAGSLGAPCFHVALVPPANTRWQAGDVLAVELPVDPPAQRDYSIASIATDGAAHLLIRQTRRPDGSIGIGSGFLTQQASLQSSVRARVRRNATFHAPLDARPMILVGNGTGIAGLRALLKERIAAQHKANWLLFGERQAAHDFHYRDELLSWQSQGSLAELDLAFSRDGAQRRYVQDVLRKQAQRLSEWVEQGAAIYVCGSAQGMASGVHAALVEVLGETLVEKLRDDGRYRRDVY